MTLLWIRQCQECGKRHATKPPAEYKGDTWQDLKCKRCGSIALDYGSSQNVDPITLERLEEEEETDQ